MRGLPGRVRNGLSGRARRGEGGFTLVEVIISIAILGVVAVAIAEAFVTTGRSSIGVSQRFNESHDAQIASAYLATDVQSNAALTSTVCGSGGSPVVNFGYADGSVVTYAYGPSGAESQLTRRFCSGGGGVTTDTVLVHNGGSMPTLTCDGGVCDVATTSQPNQVSITIAEHNGATGANDYTYSLSGSRRACVDTVVGATTTTAPCAGSTSSPPPPAPYGLIAMQNGTVALGGNNNSTLTVYGPMVVDHDSTGNGVPAVSIGGNGNSARIRVYQSATDNRAGVFAIRQGGVCSNCSSTSVSPGYPPTSYTDSVTDPFAALPYPDEAPFRTATPPQVFSDGKYHGPGVYTTQLGIAGKQNEVIKFDPGTYILEAGISFTGNNYTVTGTDVMLFNGCGQNSPTCGPGSGSGTFNFSGGATVNLEPPQSGTYQYMLLFQGRNNSNNVTIAGGAQPSSLKGIVYARAAQLSMGAGNAALNIWCVAGTNIVLQGGASVSIGKQ